VPQGERNTTIARLAGRYLNKGLSREETLPILLDINSRNKPPLNETEIERTLDSIIKTHQRSLPDKIEDKAKENRGIHYHLTTLDEVFEYPEPTYLIDPILIEGTVSVLGAYTGTGKSIAALSIIKSILTGEPLWAKYHVIRTGPVLLIDEETPQSFLRERATKMDFASGLPLFLLHFQDVRLDRDDFFNALMEKIEEVRPTLVVIDSLIRVHRLKEDDAVSMSLVVGGCVRSLIQEPHFWSSTTIERERVLYPKS
jgi:RecA-family ATPase